ncbi:putative MFS-type transporter [Wickerhamomyces ciferrii]|uniref:MFS-type transporter n=1 Tax=Wickerhamomyces ciferrii (strain ATCC 14091 / BCRC 22168 / CBS 111 / JCM 3599 / NBRC 0793 / NRRL Y-1031 F-60-10) TaxID=1206466 RepID=K0KJU3_WICCF|nr:putative MFS-type transporter [Wickerhamomyces ciferrii]CCH41734.1 putative MFS-type transporter [Wickerhamomyces ciferrii]
MGQEHSPLLKPDSKALDDPTLASPGLVARDLAHLDEQIDPLSTTSTPNYGSSSQDIESQTQSGSPEDTDATTEFTSAQLRVIIGSLYVGSFLAALDTTIVTTLLSTIASSINSVSKMSWIAASYLLTCSAFQPLYGKLSDIYGRKPLLIFSNVTFALGCLISGFSHDLIGLSVGRAITGIGGGGLTSLGTIATSDLVPLKSRGVYQGLGNIAFGVGAATGGIYGALFEKYLGWEYAFFSQVPIALLSGFLIWKYLQLPKGSLGLGLPGSRLAKLKQVDFIGATFLVSSLLSFMVLVSFSGNEIKVNGSGFWGLIIFSLGTLLAFIYVELYVATQPIIPVQLFAYITVLSSGLTNWFMTMSVFTYLFYMPVFWSSVLGLTPTEIGLRTIANFVGVSSGSFLSGIYMKRTGRYYKLAVITGLFTILGVYQLYKTTKTTSLFFQYIELLIPGAGYAASLTVTLIALIAAVPHDQQASTTSIQYAFRATGSTIGVSVSSFIFQKYLLSSLNKNLLANIPEGFTKADVLKIIEKSFNSSEYTWKAPEVFRNAIIDSYDLSTHKALLFSVVTCIIAVIVSLFMKEHHLHSSIQRK